MATRNSRQTLKYLMLVLAVVSCKCVAQEPDLNELNELKGMVESKRFVEAFELSHTLLEEWGGEPAFDLLAGQAAYGSGGFQEAVFAFERVLIMDPDVLTARILLAFSYFQVKNYGAAQVELTKLLQEELSSEDADQVREYLAFIAEAAANAVRQQKVSFTMGYGYDTNVNSGTSEETVNFPTVGEFVLPDGSRETEDTLAEMALVYSYQEKLSQNSNYAISAGLSHIGHRNADTLNRSTLNLVASYSDVFDDTNFTVMGYFQPMLFNNDYFRSAIGTSVDVSWTIAERWIWLIGAGYASINNILSDDQDLTQYSTKTRLTYLGERLHVMDLSYSDDDSKLESGRHNGKNFWALSYNYLWPVTPQWLLTLSALYQDIEHDDIQPTFQIKRLEENITVGLNVDYTPDKEWIVSGRFGFSDKKSNIAIYDYDRSFGKILVTYNF